MVCCPQCSQMFGVLSVREAGQRPKEMMNPKGFSLEE